MDRFERLNRETREHRNTCVDRFNTSTSAYTNFNYLNNRTFKANNGIYSTRYF